MLIFSVNLPVFLIYTCLVLAVLKQIGFRTVEAPMNYYIGAFLFIFLERLFDATFHLFFIERQKEAMASFMYFLVINVHAITDRISMIITMHFTLQMREVMVKLRSETVEEHKRDMISHEKLKWVIYASFALLQLPILGIRIYVRYMRYLTQNGSNKEDLVLVDFILRIMYLIFELSLLYIFLMLIRFFTMRRL